MHFGRVTNTDFSVVVRAILHKYYTQIDPSESDAESRINFPEYYFVWRERQHIDFVLVVKFGWDKKATSNKREDSVVLLF